MSTANYLNLIFSGYFKNPNTLKRYLIRNQKIEERNNFITEDEFYDNCKDVLLKLKEDIYFQYKNRKSELLKVLDFKKHKGIDTIETQKQYDTIDLSHFTINLYSITNQKIKAHLSYSDIEFIEQTIEHIFVNVDKKIHNNFTNTNWFKIGLLFANGEMDILLKKFDNNGTKIAKKLGNGPGLRPFITEGIGINKKKSDKSIFSNKDKRRQIITYCNQNNIKVIQSFIDKIPIE